MKRKTYFLRFGNGMEYPTGDKEKALDLMDFQYRLSKRVAFPTFTGDPIFTHGVSESDPELMRTLTWEAFVPRGDVIPRWEQKYLQYKSGFTTWFLLCKPIWKREWARNWMTRIQQNRIDY